MCLFHQIRGDKITKETEQGNKKLVEINKTLDQLKSGVLHLFGAIDCDPSSIKDMLGSEKGVTNKNIMKYMGIIEGKTMDYLQKHEYNEMKVRMYSIALEFLYRLWVLSLFVHTKENIDASLVGCVSFLNSLHLILNSKLQTARES